MRDSGLSDLGETVVNLSFGRELCGNLLAASEREWLVTDGLGGFAMGTISGELTRHLRRAVAWRRRGVSPSGCVCETPREKDL